MNTENKIRIMDLEQKIVELKEQLSLFEKAKEDFESLTPQQKVAEIIHELVCERDHVKECSWKYESWSDDPLKTSHKYYYDIADKMIEELSINPDIIIKIINKIQNLVL